MTHFCHWPDCDIPVPPKMWGCKKHWFMLPLRIRKLIWSTYRPGQETDKKPSKEYLEAAMMAQKYAQEELVRYRAINPLNEETVVDTILNIWGVEKK